MVSLVIIYIIDNWINSLLIIIVVFLGVAPGTNFKTNPNAMHTIQSNTIFTNVGETEDGGVFWEGMEDEVDTDRIKIKTWLGEVYDKKSGKPAAHPNSRYGNLFIFFKISFL